MTALRPWPGDAWGIARRTVALAACVMAACLVITGCSRTVHGDAAAGGAGEGPAAQKYAKLLEECAVVPEDAIAQITGVQVVWGTFSGAVCRWRSLDGAADIQLNWFETGTLEREKAVAERLGYTAEPVRVSGALAYVLHPGNDPSSCGALGRAGGAGVIGWWVHSTPAEPCEAARKLLELSVNRTL